MSLPSTTRLPSLHLLPSLGASTEPGAGRVLTPLGIEMQDALPPVLRESADYLAVINALSRECERVASFIEIVRAQLNPATADRLLGVWERITRQTVEPAGLTIEERQAAVIGRLRKMLSIGHGTAWEEQVTVLIGPGWDYEEHIPGDGSTPAAGTLRIKLPFPPEGSRYADAAASIREVTPAHLELEFEAEGGFILDVSELDLETMPV